MLTLCTLEHNIVSGILREQYSGTVWAFIKILFLVSGLLGNSVRTTLWRHFRGYDLNFELP